MRGNRTNRSLLGASLSVLAALALAPAIARAEEHHTKKHPGTIIRNVNPSARNIGCSRFLLECPGVTDVRTGLVVVDVSPSVARDQRYALIGWFQGAARPNGGLLSSQMMSGAGVRARSGHTWVQAGGGFGAMQTAPGPKTITTVHALSIARPAAMFGLGRDVATFHGGPVLVALDGGTTLDDGGDGHVYQLTASLEGSL